MALTGGTNAEKIWNYLRSKGFNDYACAGIIGNLDCESSLNPKNLQDSYQSKLGFTDDTYTDAVDNGTYSKEQFVYDQAGYSLCQWTYWSRKKNFYEFTMASGRSIGDLENALDFFYKEISESFTSVYMSLMNASSVCEASNVMLLKFECPANTGTSAQNTRASFSQKYYDRFASRSNIGGVSNMGYLTCTKGQATKLSAYFNSTEMDCHGSGCCSATIINEALVERLTKIREHFGVPVTITSGYRCPTHNRRVGGATGSRHSKGDAADIVVSGVAPRTVAQYAESIGIMGIGLYETSSDGHFVHIDTRTKKSFWYGQNEAYRSTFGGYTGSGTSSSSSGSSGSSSSSSSSTTTTTARILTWGSNGDGVKVLQESLIKLGYSCGEYGADGAYGAGTSKAVKQFQVDNGLVKDGIAGPMTQAAIKSALALLEAGSGLEELEASDDTDEEVKESYNGMTVGDKVIVTASVLNVRKGPSTRYSAIRTVKRGSTYTLSDIDDGWGVLSELSGWVCLQYCKKA